MKIEHIGIAVKDLGLSNDLFEKLLGKAPYKEEISMIREKKFNDNLKNLFEK